MNRDRDSDLIKVLSADDIVALDGHDPHLRDTIKSCEKLETLFSRVRLPANLMVEPEAQNGPLELPGFTAIRRLGGGGFGEVHLAEDQRLRRRVAIKVPRAGRWNPPDFHQRFLQEARLVAQLNHPAVVTLYDAIERDGQCYLVSEYVDGGTLEELLADGPLPIERSILIAKQIAEGLSHAHQRGIVHRDLKPTNILIDPGGNPRITDFGLAIHDEGQSSHSEQVAGTIEYMSPEQLPSGSTFVDGRTDIWSFGVILYRMLTGRLPFGGNNREELFHEIRQREPKPPRQLDSSIPIGLQEICLKCLRKELADRYSSASEIVADLRRSTSHNDKGLRRLLIFAAFACLFGISILMFLTHKSDSDPASAFTSPLRKAVTDLEIESFKIRHLRYDENDLAESVGIIGQHTQPVRVHDEFRVELKFNQPAYFYLMEFTSDGRLQLHYSSSDTNPNQRQDRFEFPQESDCNLCLSDGTGLHVVALLASTKPLPPFNDWRSRIGEIPWRVSQGYGVWRYVNGGFAAGHFFRERSILQSHPAAPDEFARLCRFLVDHADQRVVEAIAFQVDVKK